MNKFQKYWEQVYWRAETLWSLFPRNEPSLVFYVLLPAFIIALVAGAIAFSICQHLSIEGDVSVYAFTGVAIFGFPCVAFVALPSFNRLYSKRKKEDWQHFAKEYPNEAGILKNQSYSHQVMATTLFWS